MRHASDIFWDLPHWGWQMERVWKSRNFTQRWKWSYYWTVIITYLQYHLQWLEWPSLLFRKFCDLLPASVAQSTVSNYRRCRSGSCEYETLLNFGTSFCGWMKERKWQKHFQQFSHDWLSSVFAWYHTANCRTLPTWCCNFAHSKWHFASP